MERKRTASGIKNLIEKTASSFRRHYSENAETLSLEQELEEENRLPPQRKIDRARRKGELILHSKHILIVIVLLNLVDCVLVLGELILDIHYVKDILETSDIQTQEFVDKMQAKYPDNLYDHDIDHLDVFFGKIHEAHCQWNHTHDHSRTEADNNTATDAYVRKRRSSQSARNHATSDLSSGHKTARAHSIWEDIAHGLHKASIAILAVLFVENVFKIVCMGGRFFHHKLEVFDAVIVLASFSIDLVFLKGLTEYRIQDGIFILSFLLPWRVIRVVNSLIVAVLDHEHFRLKMMYKKQKTVSAELKSLKEIESQFEHHLKKIERFCLNEGIPQRQIQQHVHADFKKGKCAISSMASFALDGMVPGFMNIFSTDEPRAGYASNNNNCSSALNSGISKGEVKCDSNGDTADHITHEKDDKEDQKYLMEKIKLMTSQN